jgi:hypothetical protein
MVDTDYSNKPEEMIPFFSISSRDFDRDLIILKKVLYQFEQQTHSENAYIFSKRATMAADGGSITSSLSQTLHKRFFNWLCRLAFLLIIKKLQR